MPLSNENMGWLSKKSDEIGLALFPDQERMETVKASCVDHKNSWEKNSKTRSANATSATFKQLVFGGFGSVPLKKYSYFLLLLP